MEDADRLRVFLPSEKGKETPARQLTGKLACCKIPVYQLKLHQRKKQEHFCLLLGPCTSNSAGPSPVTPKQQPPLLPCLPPLCHIRAVAFQFSPLSSSAEGVEGICGLGDNLANPMVTWGCKSSRLLAPCSRHLQVDLRAQQPRLDNSGMAPDPKNRGSRRPGQLAPVGLVGTTTGYVIKQQHRVCKAVNPIPFIST